MAAVGVRKSRSPRAKYGEIPLSSGEVEYLTRKDEAERRRQRLLAVRDQERLVAQQVTQRYRANLRKLQQKKRQETQLANKETQDVLLSELHRNYQSSLQNMGSAQCNAREKLLELLELAQQEQQKWSYNETFVEKVRNGKAAEELDEEQQASMARRKEIDANMQRLKELSTKQRTLANERARREIEMQVQLARQKEEELAWKRTNEPEEVITMNRPHRNDVTAYHFTRLHCLATPAVDPIVSARPAVKIIRHNTNHPSAANASEEAAKYRDEVDQRREQNRVKMELNSQQATDRGNNASDHDENKKNGEKVMEWLALLRNKERQELMQHAINESREQQLDEEAAEAEFARMFGIEADVLESSAYSVEKAKSIDRVRVSWPKSADSKFGGTVVEKLTQMEEFESRRRQANSHSLKENRRRHTSSHPSDRVVSSTNDQQERTRQYRVPDQQRRRQEAYLDLGEVHHNEVSHDESIEFTLNRASRSHRSSSIKNGTTQARQPSATNHTDNMSSATNSRRFESEDAPYTDRGEYRDFNDKESVAVRHEVVGGLNQSAPNGTRDELFDEKLASDSRSSSPVDVGTRQFDYMSESEHHQMRAHSSPLSSSMASEIEEFFSTSNGSDEQNDEPGFIATSYLEGQANKSPNSAAPNDELAPVSRQPVAADRLYEPEKRKDYAHTSSNLISNVDEGQKQIDERQTIDRRTSRPTTDLDRERSVASSRDESPLDSFQQNTAVSTSHPTIQRTRVAMPTQIDEARDNVKPDFFLNMVKREENNMDQDDLARSVASRGSQYSASYHSDYLDDGNESIHNRLSLSSRSSVSKNGGGNRFSSTQQSNPILTRSFSSSKRAQSVSSFGVEGDDDNDALSVDGSFECEQEILDEELGELYADKIRQKRLESSDRRDSSVYVPQYSLPHSDSMSSFDGSFYERDEESFMNKLVPMFPNGIPSRIHPGGANQLQEQLDIQLIDPSLSRMVNRTNIGSTSRVPDNSGYEGTGFDDENSNSASGVSSFGFSAQLNLIAGSSRILNFERGMRSAESSMRGSLVGFMIRGSEVEFESNGQQRQDNEDEDDGKSVDQYSIVSSSSSSSLSMEARFKYLVSMAATSGKSLPARFNLPAASFGDPDMSVPPAPIHWEHSDVNEEESIHDEWRDDHSMHNERSEFQRDEQNHPEPAEEVLGSIAHAPTKRLDMTVPPVPSLGAVGYHTPAIQKSESQLPPLTANTFDMSVPPAPLNDITDKNNYHTEVIQEAVTQLPAVPAKSFDMSVPPFRLNEDNDESASSSSSSGRQYSSSESSRSADRHTGSQNVSDVTDSLPPRSFGTTDMSRPPAPIIDIRGSSSSASRSDGTRTDNDRPRGLESEEEKEEDSASEVSSPESIPRSAGLVSSEILEPSYSRRNGDVVIIASTGNSSGRGNNEHGSLEPSSRSTSLADALRSRRPGFLRRMENRQEAIKNPRRVSTGSDKAYSASDRPQVDRQSDARPRVASSTAASLELNPQQENLLGRLASGERAKVSSKEMKDRTKRLYQQLPEVVERKRQEEILRRRRQRLDELREQEKVSGASKPGPMLSQYSLVVCFVLQARRMQMKQRREKQRG